MSRRVNTIPGPTFPTADATALIALKINPSPDKIIDPRINTNK